MQVFSPFPSNEKGLAGNAPAGLAYRPATQRDLAFLKRLYAHSRAMEMAAVPWPRAVKEPFLDSQFQLQHEHYVRHYPAASFLIVERDGDPVGRLYVDDREGDLHVIDISLLEPMQGKGVGTDVFTSLQAIASIRGAGVTLHVSQLNSRARSLYERLGFRITGTTDTHVAMRWIS